MTALTSSQKDLTWILLQTPRGFYNSIRKQNCAQAHREPRGTDYMTIHTTTVKLYVAFYRCCNAERTFGFLGHDFIRQHFAVGFKPCYTANYHRNGRSGQITVTKANCTPSTASGCKTTLLIPGKLHGPMNHAYIWIGSKLKETTNFNMSFSFVPCEEQTYPQRGTECNENNLRLWDMELEEGTI